MKKSIIFIIVIVIIVGCVRSLFYPPAVTSDEVFSKEGEKLFFNEWNLGLETHVKNGQVAYSEWKKDNSSVTNTIKKLSSISKEEIARDHLLAMYINAYNVFTVQLIFEYFPNIKSINDIPKAKRWKDVRWQIGDEKISLNELEHDIIRKKFTEPRIHFAIVCASVGCPNLLNHSFEGDLLEEQLNQVTRNFFQREENLKISKNTIYLSSILDWFRGDFVRDELATKLKWFGDEYLKASENTRLLMFITKFAPKEIAEKIQQNYQQWSISYSKYDWNLNGK